VVGGGRGSEGSFKKGQALTPSVFVMVGGGREEESILGGSGEREMAKGLMKKFIPCDVIFMMALAIGQTDLDIFLVPIWGTTVQEGRGVISWSLHEHSGEWFCRGVNWGEMTGLTKT